MSQGPMHHHHGAGRLNMPFVGIPSFLRAAICANLGELDADIAVMGVPTDEGSPFMPGSRFGPPRAIREHSMRFVTGRPGYYGPEARRHFLERRCWRVGSSTSATPTSCPPTSSTPSATSPA